MAKGPLMAAAPADFSHSPFGPIHNCLSLQLINQYVRMKTRLNAYFSRVLDKDRKSSLLIPLSCNSKNNTSFTV